MVDIRKPKKKKEQKVRMTKAQIDAKMYGAEPDYSSGMPDEKNYTMDLSYGLHWYGTSFDRKAAEKFVVKWLNDQNFFEISKDKIKSVTENFTYFIPTFFALMKMHSRGWELSEKQVFQIKDHIDEVIRNKKKKEENSESTDNAQNNVVQSKVSPHERIKEKANTTILPELEEMLDKWMLSNDANTRKGEYNLSEKLVSHDIKGPGLNIVKQWIQSNLDELKEVKSKSDPELTEGYSNIRSVNLNFTIKTLESLLDTLELERINSKNRTQRKPRKKKEVPISKIIANFKYQKEDLTYKISSISPEKIIDAKTLILFDTKTRKIKMFYSDSGMTVKGTTIQNFDEALSFTQTIRKPEEMMPILLTKTKKQIEKALKGLTTKPSQTNGRTSDTTIILRVL